MAGRVRAQALGLDFAVLAQGVPFVHAGSELLRSKSLDRNSYNSGDWFNRMDWRYRHNNFGVGLPPQPDNGADWDLMRPLLADPALQPKRPDIEASAAHLLELLAIRKSSPLFRLQTAADISARLAFHNTGPDQIPGLIVMSLSDKVEPDLDPTLEQIVVLFNATDTPQAITLGGLAGQGFALHPVQSASKDRTVRAASFDTSTGRFSVPARTTAVFVQGETAAITVIKQAEPGSRRNFRFAGDLGSFRLDAPIADDGDRIGDRVTLTVPPGVYTVAEHVPARWFLGGIACDMPDRGEVDPAHDHNPCYALGAQPGYLYVVFFGNSTQGSAASATAAAGLTAHGPVFVDDADEDGYAGAGVITDSDVDTPIGEGSVYMPSIMGPAPD
jgi:hypothetical protein